MRDLFGLQMCVLACAVSRLVRDVSLSACVAILVYLDEMRLNLRANRARQPTCFGSEREMRLDRVYKRTPTPARSGAEIMRIGQIAL